MQQLDWEYWINQACVLSDAIEILKHHNPASADILTKVHSLDEARIKINYFRLHGVKNNIVIVPFSVSKASVVTATGNILVDDGNKNLLEWEKEAGYPIYFGSKESLYPKIESLEEIFDDEKVKQLILR